jgi:beta-N-acetylhexosaminidase
MAGVIFFARNIVEPAQVAELSREVSSLAVDWPLWVSVDQEGGRVARLRGAFTEWPPMIAIGRSDDEALAVRFGEALADELRAVGINYDFAPVLDVHSNPANPVIGDRALSSDPQAAARLAAAVIGALQGRGVAACGKHFPGHGDTSVDSHEAMPVVPHDRRRLDAVEFVPFRRAIEAGVASIMTAHVLVPELDPEHVASFSSRVVTGILKQELGFQGLVVSDDLGMKAVSATTPLPDATVSAIRAGCDVTLLCNSPIDDQWRAIEAVIHAVERGDIGQERVDDAFGRQRRMKERFALRERRTPPPLDRVGSEVHRAIAAEMAGWL